MLTKILSVLVGVLLAPVALFMAIMSAGAGHGHYVAAKILFPFTMASTYIWGTITLPFIILAIVQFPFYGWLTGCAIVDRKWKAPAWIVGGVHLALAIFVYFTSPQLFK